MLTIAAYNGIAVAAWNRLIRRVDERESFSGKMCINTIIVYIICFVGDCRDVVVFIFMFMFMFFFFFFFFFFFCLILYVFVSGRD